MDPLKLLMDTHARLMDERAKTIKRLTEIDAQIKDQEIAIRVVKDTVQRAALVGRLNDFATEIQELAKAPTEVPKTEPQRVEESWAMSRSPPKVSVKELLLKILGGAYPKGLTSGAIRRVAQARYGFTINPNTATGTLGRLKDRGQVRLDGREWFAVPSNAQAPSRNTEAAGDLLGNAAPTASTSRPALPPGDSRAPVNPGRGGGT